MHHHLMYLRIILPAYMALQLISYGYHRLGNEPAAAKAASEEDVAWLRKAIVARCPQDEITDVADA